ncbi:uncharacterized protein LOC143860945 [Tasmannia lanceolata]|uniref:uncharacterized protein LOC143860945 n=1 Tax=Tasmannia lanceolata TaxID=3420 RepID=UPI004063ED0B
MSSGTNNLAWTARNWRRRNEYGAPAPNNNDRNRPTSVPRPFQHLPDDGASYGLFEERVRTGPYGLNRFPLQPHSPTRIIALEEGTVNPHLQQFIRDSPPGIWGQRHMGLVPREEEAGLTQAEFKKAMSKLRMQIYNPTYPRKRAWKRGLFSNYKANNNTHKKEEADEEEDEDEDEGKECTICLDEFEPNEHVLITPCNHMFHKDCIVPWVKAHGQCPVCRHVLCERRRRENALPLNNNNNVAANGAMGELLLLISAMEEAYDYVNFYR